MRRILFYGILITIISCSTETSNDVAFSSKVPFPQDTIVVATTTSRFENLVYPIKTIGRIRSAKRSNLVFERSGILKTINVVSGDRVKSDQVIASLKNEEEYLRKENARISLKRAQVEYQNEMLALGDSAYYKEKWEIVKENVQLNAGLQAAEVNLKQAELAYRQTFVRAPLSGIVEGIDLRPGDFVSSDLSIGSIYEPDALEVTCDVLEYDVLKIRKGMRATIFPLAEPNTELEGVVVVINPAVDRKGLSRMLIAIIDPANVIPGMSVRVEINVTDKPSIVIPKQAVVKRSEQHVVFNFDKGLAKWNFVTLGKDNGEKVQILEGIEKNMEIIISNNLQLGHDSPVKLE